MEKLKRITIGGKIYPIKMDLNVLAALQDGYGSLHDFEMDIKGIRYARDAEGKVIYDGGRPMVELVEPSIRAVRAALPAMINEGLEIEADEQNREFIPVDEKEIIRDCAISYEALAAIISEEFKRCFEIKKL